MAEPRNPAKTRQYIDDASGRYLRIADPVQRARYAWAYTRGTRRLGDDKLCRELGIAPPRVDTAPFDLNLADAEHYLYARFLAGSTGDPATGALVGSYELWKSVKYWTGNEKDLRTDQRFPVLPPSIEAINWGMKGVADGLGDYRKLHGGKAGSIGSATMANMGMLRSQY